MNAEHLMMAGGLAAFLLTVWWVRRRHLREKYALAWLTVATVILLCGLFPGLIMAFADSARLSYAAAMLFVALGVMYVYAFTVSLSLSNQYRRAVRLSQEVALLEARLRALEQRALPGSDPAAARP